MAGEWPSSPLGVLVDLRTGKLDSNQAEPDGAYPFFTCAPEPLRIGQYAFDCDAVLLAGNNANGVFHLHRCRGKFNAYQRTYVITIKDDSTLDTGFLSYALRTCTQRLGEYSQGTATKFLTMGILSHLPIPIPPLYEQQAIACILGSLDDKIELNRRRSRTLEGMARAIFQSWFVDFDPVHAKAAGQAPPGLKPELAALLPARLEDSPLGPIPAGWRVGTVSDLLSMSRESIDPGDSPEELFDHYSIPAFDAGRSPAIDAGEAIKSQKFAIGTACVLVSKLNPKTPRVWIPDTPNGRRQIASTEFLVCCPTGTFGRAFVYCLACGPTFVDHMTARASGTSNSHQRVRPADFLGYQLALPSAEVVAHFEQIVGPLFASIANSGAESRTLAALRDALVPKLISGEICVAGRERPDV